MEQPTITNLESAPEQIEAEQKSFDLADLSLTDEQLAEIKGGPGGFGGINLNHNETTVEEEAAETETVDDLPVTDDEQVKGGPKDAVYMSLKING